MSLELGHRCKQLLSIMPKVPEVWFDAKWKDPFWFLPMEYLPGPPLEVVLFDQLGRNLLFHCDRTVHCTTSLHLLFVGNSEKE